MEKGEWDSLMQALAACRAKGEQMRERKVRDEYADGIQYACARVVDVLVRVSIPSVEQAATANKMATSLDALKQKWRKEVLGKTIATCVKCSGKKCTIKGKE